MGEATPPVAHPALEPPPILPWNGFDTDQTNDRSLAVKLIAEILMDDEWHHREDVINEVVYELELHPSAVSRLIYYLRIHGDIRQDEEWLRITTRWRNWSPQTEPPAEPPAAPPPMEEPPDVSWVQTDVGLRNQERNV